jgi:AraC-like DNA-binding protein
MNTAVVECCASSVASCEGSGLFRGTFAGRGRSLTDTFSSLEQHADVQRLSRHGRRNLFGARIPLDPGEGVGHWEFTRIGSGVYVVVGNLAYHSKRLEVVPGDDLVQFYFKLSGDLTMKLQDDSPLRINRPSLLVYQQPRGVDIEEWLTASAQERCVAISMDRSYLIEEFFPSKGELPALLESFVMNEVAQIQYRQVPLSAQMFELATRLIDNPYSGSMGLIYTEALTFELLCLALSSLEVVESTQSFERYSARDVRGLHSARRILMTELSPPPTICQLARVVGVNETTLKKGFRALFGETVFDFSLRCRMERAMSLLKEREMQVARVAESVGYSHQTSFATAFRKYFGMCPKDARPPIAH